MPPQIKILNHIVPSKKRKPALGVPDDQIRLIKKAHLVGNKLLATFSGLDSGDDHRLHNMKIQEGWMDQYCT